MSETVALSIHLGLERDYENFEELREAVERSCRALAEEFPELTRVEVVLAPNGAGFEASAHVTGKGTEVAAHAKASEPEPTAEKVLDTLRHQLRKTHDKRIFAHRREAKLHPPKKS
jgi:ribosome-associated translation inhibitor RaiA